MRIRKIFKFITCPVLAVLLLTGCGSVKKNVKNIISDIAENVSEAVSDYNEKNKYNSPHEYAVDTFNAVLELVQAKDSQAIYDMFSEYDKENVDLMPDIEKLVEFMDGKVVEMRHVGASNDYSSVRDGVTVSAGYSATTYVTTEQGTLYWFKVGVVTTADDETKLGLDWIYIIDSDAFDNYIDKCVEWNDRRINGAKEPEPERPDDMEIGVHYFKSQKDKNDKPNN